MVWKSWNLSSLRYYLTKFEYLLRIISMIENSCMSFMVLYSQKAILEV